MSPLAIRIVGATTVNADMQAAHRHDVSLSAEDGEVQVSASGPMLNYHVLLCKHLLVTHLHITHHNPQSPC